MTAFLDSLTKLELLYHAVNQLPIELAALTKMEMKTIDKSIKNTI